MAYFLIKLQLAQAEGQGIPTIIRTMKEEGCPPPIFEIGEETVSCTLPAHPRHALMRDLNTIENKLIIGNHEDALFRLEKLLDEDPYNFRSLELYCEVNNILKTPLRVFEFMNSRHLDPKLINASTLLLIAETILQVQNSSRASTLADELINQALSDRLEESEIKRVMLHYRKKGEDEKALEFIQNVITRSPTLANSSVLRDIAARARIELAKKCIDTARNQSQRSDIKAKAWDLCRKYLDEAEKDINIALEHVTNEIDRDYIQRDLEFLRHMQKISTKPTSTQPTSRTFDPKKHPGRK